MDAEVAINVDRIHSATDYALLTEGPVFNDTVLNQRIRMGRFFRMDAIDLPGVTDHTSNSFSIEFTTSEVSIDDNSILLPTFKTIGHVRIRIGEVAKLSPPTIEF
jgi:hypothetical protein